MDPHHHHHHRSKADLSMTSLTTSSPHASHPRPTATTPTTATHSSPPPSLPPPQVQSLPYPPQQQQPFYRQPSPSHQTLPPPVYHTAFATGEYPRPPSHHSQSPVPADSPFRQPHSPTQQFEHHYRPQQRSPSIGPPNYQPAQSPKMTMPYQFQQPQGGYAAQSPTQQQQQQPQSQQGQFPGQSPTGGAQNNYFLHHSPPPTLPRPTASSPAPQSKAPQLAQPQPRLPPVAPPAAVANLPKQPSPAPLPVNQIPPGGAPARRYLNENVTPVLLEGMKMLAREQPKEPLLALARFLEEAHKEAAEAGKVKMEGVNGSG